MVTQILQACNSCKHYFGNLNIKEEKSLLYISSDVHMYDKEIIVYIPERYWCDSNDIVCSCKIWKDEYTSLIYFDSTNFNNCFINGVERTDKDMPYFIIEQTEINKSYKVQEYLSDDFIVDDKKMTRIIIEGGIQVIDHPGVAGEMCKCNKNIAMFHIHIFDVIHALCGDCMAILGKGIIDGLK